MRDYKDGVNNSQRWVWNYATTSNVPVFVHRFELLLVYLKCVFECVLKINFVYSF